MAHHWIRLAAKPLSLKVVIRAADTLGVSRPQALGHLCAFWDWLAEQSDDGSVADIPDDQLEEAAGWFGTRGAFALFVRNRHVDRQGRVRDWQEFMGPLVAIRKKARERMAAKRAAQKRALPDNGNSGENNPDVRTNMADVLVSTLHPIDHPEVRESLRTTGLYLGAELDLSGGWPSDEWARETPQAQSSSACPPPMPVRSERLYAREGEVRSHGKTGCQVGEDASLQNCYKPPTLLHNRYKESGLFGIELVREFARRFYAGDEPAMLDALRRLRAVLRPAGVRFQGRTIRATPALVVAAINETLAHPPTTPSAAIVFVLRKLQSGRLHETRTADGQLVTEALAEQARVETANATEYLLGAAPELFAGIKSLPTAKRQPQSQRTPQPGVRGACPVLPPPDAPT